MLTDVGSTAVAQLRRARKRLFAELLCEFDLSELALFGTYLDRVMSAFRQRAS